jgi:hypothetical protein
METIFKLFLSTIDGLKKIIFNSEKEHDFKSSSFDGFKFSIFIAIVFLIALEGFTISRLYTVAVKNIELTKTASECKKQ